MAARFLWAMVIVFPMPVLAESAASPQFLDIDSLLVDGQTSCQSAVSVFGAPAQSFHGGQLLAFRLQRIGKGYSVTPTDDWKVATFSLIVSCDPQGVVRRHALIDVKREP